MVLEQKSARRASGDQFEHSKLSRLPHGAIRQHLGRANGVAGAEIRRADLNTVRGVRNWNLKMVIPFSVLKRTTNASLQSVC